MFLLNMYELEAVMTPL